jgi:hypothetical protein
LLVGVVQSKTLAERILVRPVVLGEVLVHDRDAGRGDGILGAKIPSREKRDGHGVEVVLVHHRRQDRDVVLPHRELEPFRLDRHRAD